MANDFSSDASCKALWSFESGALSADSKGTNTLTASDPAPAESTGDFKEGACCADFENDNNNWFYCNDADLDAGFPLKDGDTTKQITVGCWVKPESWGNDRYIWSKHISADGYRGLGLMLYYKLVKLYWCHNSGNSYYALNLNSDAGFPGLENGQWYWIGVAADGVAKTLTVLLYDLNADSIYKHTYTLANELWVADTPFVIGNRGNLDTGYDFDGLIDEVVVFNREMPTWEMLRIALGDFPGSAMPTDAIQVEQALAQVEYEEDPQIQVAQAIAQVEYDPTPAPITPLNLSGDSSCKAFWRFESGDITADSKGTNTLTNNGGLTSFADLMKEGSGSLYLPGNSAYYMSILDDDLDDGFPLKSGDTNKVVSLAFWINVWENTNTVFEKGGLRFALNFLSRIYFYWPYDGGIETWDTGLTIPAINDWAHLTITIDGINKTGYILAYRPSDGQTYVITHTFSNELLLNTDPLTIGCKNDTSSPFKGLIDQFLVFNRLLTYYDHYHIAGRGYTKAYGENNFLGDSSLKGNWKFNSSGLFADSSGNDNTLTDSGAYAYSYPYAREGDQCLYTSVYGGLYSAYVADGSLSTGFPLKNGDTTKQLSWCFFVTGFNNAGGWRANSYIVSKGTDNNIFGVFFPSALGTTQEVQIKWGDGSTVTTYATGIILDWYKTYHIAVVADGVNKTLSVRVYDFSTGQVLTYSTTPSTELGVSTGNFTVGPAGGWTDDLYVLNRLLSAAEIDAIREGAYDYPEPPVAVAGSNQSVNEGDLVTLDGTESSDPDGDTITYLWAQTSGTEVELSDVTSAQPTFTAPEVDVGGEVLTFQLIVNDGVYDSDADTVDITVGDVPEPDSTRDRDNLRNLVKLTPLISMPGIVLGSGNPLDYNTLEKLKDKLDWE